MSDFTTEFRYLIDSEYPLGLDKYPIFNESYRETLNNLIKNHFYFHEIGMESTERFVFELNNVMREIMPYYNQLYNAELLTYDPFIEYSKELTQVNNETQNNVDNVVETIDSLASTDSDSTQVDLSTIESNVEQNDNSSLEENSNTSTNGSDVSNAVNNSKSVGSNTPKDLLAIGTIEGNVYASEATIGENVSETTNNSNNETDLNRETLANNNSNVESNNKSTSDTASTDITTVDVDSTTTKDAESTSNVNQNNSTTDTGHNSSKTKLIVELRDSFINIDQMILNDINLQECFMMVYGTI